MSVKRPTTIVSFGTAAESRAPQISIRGRCEMQPSRNDWLDETHTARAEAQGWRLQLGKLSSFAAPMESRCGRNSVSFCKEVRHGRGAKENPDSGP